MSSIRSMFELTDEPVFIDFEDDGLPLQFSYELSAQSWRERYAFMREEYEKYLWFYSPICSKVRNFRALLRRICLNCLKAEGNPKQNEPFPHVRDMDLVLGFITEEEHERQAEEERENALSNALREARTNRALDEICDAITENALEELEEFKAR